MYEGFFGLREGPFDLTTHSRFMVVTPRHREALSHVLITHATLTRSELDAFSARGFRLSEGARSKARFLSEFQRNAQTHHLAGGVTTLIIDEAQSLPDGPPFPVLLTGAPRCTNT